MRAAVILILFFSTHVFAQDTIRFNNGDVKPARVTEVGVENIKYYRSDISDGPLYTISKSEIKSIIYANGNVDVFKITPKPVQTVAVTAPSYSGMGFRQQKIRIDRNRLVYEGDVLSDGRLLDVIEECKDKNTKSRMLDVYSEMKDEKIKQYCFGFGGAGIGLACLIGGQYYSGGGNQNASVMLGGVFIGANVFIVGQVLSGIAKKNRWAKAKKIANIYNGNE